MILETRRRSCRNKMSANLLLNVVLLAALCLKVNAYPGYQANIPNGANVPNPCNMSTTWPGVGHQNVYGSGDRNPFGLDFAANNHVWDRTLCMKDSDGDGMTNGQELGDPNCTWMQGGSAPSRTTNLTHPGVCEPLGSSVCTGKNSWLMNCMPGKLYCPAINSSGAQNYTLRFPPTIIPTKETTYICYQFKLPNDSQSDIIAIEPVIDNGIMIHHMLLFACTDQPTDTHAGKAFECGMGGGMSCLSLIGIWGAGGKGQCLNSQLGFRIGPGAFQYAILQLHWNNPMLMANQMDSSGMKIYYTTQLRPNRGQVAMVGQNYLEIPPGQPEVAFTGNCSSLCTKRFPRSIYLTSSTLHMHTLGKSGQIVLSRNGQTIKVLDNVTQWDYNSPTMTDFETPIELQPGDEIQVKCVYNSTKKNTTTMYGESTQDEMCFGFFAYYPMLDGLGYCGQWKTVNICSNKMNVQFGSCDFMTYMQLHTLLPQVCANNCTSTACALIMDGMQATQCPNFPDVMAFSKVFMMNTTAIYSLCAKERPPQPPNPPCINYPFSNSAGKGATLGFGILFILIAYVAFH